MQIPQNWMTSGRDLWDIIVILIVLDSLYKNFETTTASLLETGSKTIKIIQNILLSKGAKNHVK